jgi:hypothetical protein
MRTFPQVSRTLPNPILLFAMLLFASFAFTQTDIDSGSIAPALGAKVTFTGDATGTGAANESVCQEDVNCDSYALTVTGTQAQWAVKLIDVKISWSVSANDYDLFIHQGTVAGPVVASSTGGAPENSEEAVIDPSATGVGAYAINATYFATTPGADQYNATVTVINKPAPGTGIYIKGGIQFSPNVADKAPVAPRDGEPSSRTDNYGNFYVGAIRGVPGGVDLWYNDLQPGSRNFDPYMRNPQYRCQPDSLTGQVPPECSFQTGGDGGGDIDLAVGHPTSTGTNNNPAILAFSSLVAANLSVGNSLDRGVSFTLNPLGNVPGGAAADDRQWMEFYGPKSVYLLYRTLAPALTQIQRSDDGGLTYGPAVTAGLIGQTGGIAVDQKDGTVYVSGSTGQVCVGVPLSPAVPPASYACTVAASDPNGVAHIFFPVKVGGDGTVYAAYSNDHDIFLVHSTDKAKTWSRPVRVSDGAQTRTSVFPHLEVGANPGTVGIVWYGTTDATNDDNANWKVFYAVTLNALSSVPTFRQVNPSDHYIHAGNISEGGLTGTANRNLIDYFQVSFDPRGAAVIGYADDHNDFDGHTYVTHQLNGPGTAGSSTGGAVQGAGVPAAPKLPANGAQVLDFAHDVANGLLVVTPTSDPLDILSVRYHSEPNPVNPSDVILQGAMQVSNLAVVPPDSVWRVHFTANAPFAGVSKTGSQSGIPGNPYNEYSFALSDRGDQFYLKASTDPTGARAFVWGTAVRNSDGTITYTDQGPAQGSFDTLNNTINVSVPVSQLNSKVTHGPAIGHKSVLAGLRGSTFTASSTGKRDITRGGTQFVIP